MEGRLPQTDTLSASTLLGACASKAALQAPARTFAFPRHATSLVSKSLHLADPTTVGTMESVRSARLLGEGCLLLARAVRRSPVQGEVGDDRQAYSLNHKVALVLQKVCWVQPTPRFEGFIYVLRCLAPVTKRQAPLYTGTAG